MENKKDTTFGKEKKMLCPRMKRKVKTVLDNLTDFKLNLESNLKLMAH